MPDNNKIEAYNTIMAANQLNAMQCSAFMINGIAGNPQSMSKEVLHGAIDYVTAKWKKDVELCATLAEEQKDEQKRRCDVVFKGLEALLEDSLKCHGRLLK